ncbi:P-loop containing nucleoside triphosphate hydrolase [Glarea lozoyensis ATCC 20868]|uniref:p-loop containing nucleoside triphosphate hydrolase n=1 Tax=Glarea lozoyensis (strain ATCC 20868 / MF5171) TaxID=1116229 RepID=S3DTE4_GLAL2|nr:P-loop containing nucleoside triphosphate hydrolase [Glarea lozoyensis ATCC 20868]EPE35216.1 P-loop containing nucleoside triphosphate hydrolase [Glarea lozoyensis ATCC 20868]
MDPPATPPCNLSPSGSVGNQVAREVPRRDLTIGSWERKGSSKSKGSMSSGHLIASGNARNKQTIHNHFETASPTPKMPPLQPVHSISGQILPYFVGRAEELSRMKTLLESPVGNGECPSYCVMWGMAGVGKTALVGKYLRGESRDTSIIWLNASTESALDQSISKALNQCLPTHVILGEPQVDMTDRRRHLKSWLDFKSPKNCVLILDDVHDKTCSILQHHVLPTRGSHCKVVVTTRSRLIAEDILQHISTDAHRCWEVKVLDTGSATDMFVRIWKFDFDRTTKIKLLSELEKSKISDVLNAVGNLPLAIQVAATYAKKENLNSAWEARNKALSWDIRNPHYQDHPLYQATPILENAFDFFFELKQNPKTAAAIFVDDLSIYDPSSISVRLFEKPAAILQSIREAPVNALLSSLFSWSKPAAPQKQNDPTPRVIDLIRTLDRLSFLTQQTHGGFESLSIHKLVQELTRKKLREQITSTVFQWQRRHRRISGEIERLHNAIGDAAHEIDPLNRSIQYEEILSHIISILRFFEECLDEDSSKIQARRLFEPLQQRLLRMQEKVVICLWERSRFEVAAASARETFGFNQKIWGPVHPVASRNRNFRDLRFQGYHEIQGVKHQDVLKLMENLKTRAKTPETELDYVACIDHYAALLRGQGRYTEAFLQCKEARDRRCKLLGIEESLEDHDNFSVVYQCLGMYEDARRHSFQALEKRENSLPEEHIDTLASHHQYATVLHCLGLYEDAKNEIIRAFEGRLRLLGDEHPDTLASQQAYADILHAEGAYENAAHHMQETLGLRRNRLGENHPDTLTTLAHLATVFLSQGKLAVAKEGVESAYKRRQEVLGDNHPDTITSMRTLASVYRYQGHYVEAEDLYTEACRESRRALTEIKMEHTMHPNSINFSSDQAWIEFKNGRYKPAERTYQDLLREQEMWLGSKHPHILGTVSSLSMVYLRLGKYKEAKASLRSALFAQNHRVKVNSPGMLSVLHNYSVLLRLQGLYEESESLGNNILVTRKQMLGTQHPDFLSSLESYASTLCCLGLYREAETLCERSLQERRTILGSAHPDTLCSIDTYSSILRVQNKDEEANSHIQNALGYRNLLSHNHPDRLLSKYNYVWFLETIGGYRGAQVISEDVLGRRRESGILPDILSSAEQTGCILLQLGEMENAQKLLRESFEGRKTLLGKDHSDTLRSLAYYCLGLVQSSGPMEAQKFLESELMKERLLDIGQMRIDSLSDMKQLARAFSTSVKGSLEQIKLPWHEKGEHSHTDHRYITAAKSLLRSGKVLEAWRELQFVSTHPEMPSLLVLALMLQGKLHKEHNILSLKDVYRIPAAYDLRERGDANIHTTS